MKHPRGLRPFNAADLMGILAREFRAEIEGRVRLACSYMEYERGKKLGIGQAGDGPVCLLPR